MSDGVRHCSDRVAPRTRMVAVLSGLSPNRAQTSYRHRPLADVSRVERAATDAQLVAEYLDGADHAAIECLLDRYSWLLLTAIRRYHFSAEDEADIYQDVCLTIWRELPRLRDHTRIKSWLM